MSRWLCFVIYRIIFGSANSAFSMEKSRHGPPHARYTSSKQTFLFHGLGSSHTVERFGVCSRRKGLVILNLLAKLLGLTLKVANDRCIWSLPKIDLIQTLFQQRKSGCTSGVLHSTIEPNVLDFLPILQFPIMELRFQFRDMNPLSLRKGTNS